MIAHITTQRAEHDVPVRTSCAALEVSEVLVLQAPRRQHYHGDTEQRREQLTDAIWESFDASGYTYGSPRVVLDLVGRRVEVSV